MKKEKKATGKAKPNKKTGAETSCRCPLCDRELELQCRETLVCLPCEVELKQCPTCGRLYRSNLPGCPTCEACR